MGVDVLRAQGRRAGRSEGVEWLGRAGLVAQGVIYALVGVLALEVALDGRDAAAPPDKQGALELVAEQPFGKVLLALLALGFAAYALWRFAQALVDRDGNGSDLKGVAKRFGFFCLGAWYGGLAVLALSRLFGPDGQSGSSGGSSGSEQRATAGVFDLPLGRELVLAAALGFVVAAGWNAYRGVSGKLEKYVRGELGKRARQAALAVGGVGYLARGAVFGLIGLFLARAAIEFDPSEAKSLDGSLYELSRQPYGPALLAGVAVGLIAFAVWCWVQARYRDV